jgi:catechol 2,3-dioxygenase-like lactoylglutathione lyase family enzyme
VADDDIERPLGMSEGPPARFLGPVHHLGLVVADCEKAAAFYRRVWGLKDVEFHIYSNSQSSVRGKPASYSIKIALGDLGSGVKLELIEVLSGDALHREMRDRAGEGVNHIAFLVENLDAAIAAGGELGFGLAIAPGEKRPNVAYLDTERACGIFTELYERGFGH